MDAVSLLNASLDGRYSIQREVGAGGMATVYLARDLRHNRAVALKVLNPDLGIVLGERFLSEIQVTASLQHPNVLPLFDSGVADHLLFYVMPYVEGESLRERLSREKQLPIEEAVRIAATIANALEYAHSHGIVHRDLKPENILLQANQPVLADFGIALAVAKAGGARITQTGISLGTPQYMSPEQATGDRVIDGRSDIYSLGAVLYEMLTGDTPHTGSTAQAIIARIMTETPRHARQVRSTVPSHLDAALERALAKLPADRFSTAREFADAITAERPATTPTQSDGPADASSARVPASRRPSATTVVSWALTVASLAVATTVLVAPHSPSRPALKMLEVTFADSVVVGGQPAISADDRQLAFVGRAAGGRAMIFVRSLSSTRTMAIPGTEDGVWPSISPDGRTLAFRQGNQLKKTLIDGGPITVVADSVAGGSGRVSWAENGDVFYPSGLNVWRVSARGGKPARLPRHETQKGYLRFDPGIILPGGDLLPVSAFPIDHSEGRLAMIDVRDGRVVDLGIQGVLPRYVREGHLVFQRRDALFAVPFSPRTRSITGPEVPLVDGVSGYAISDEGTLVYYASAVSPRRMVLVDRHGQVTATPLEPGPFETPRVSPDGRSVAFTEPNRSIWIHDTKLETATIVVNGRFQTGVDWWPDGQRIAYSDIEGGVGVIKSKSVTTTADAAVLLRDSLDLGPVSVGPPGTFLAVWRTPRMGMVGADIMVAPVDSPQLLHPLMSTPATEKHPRLSPDGQFLAYTSDQSGRWEVHVQSLTGRAQRIQVSRGGGDEPVWSRDGRELFYRTGTHMMSAVIQHAPALDVVRRETLFADSFARTRLPYVADYDVMPDNNRFVMFEPQHTRPARLLAIVNWTELLRGAKGPANSAR